MPVRINEIVIHDEAEVQILMDSLLKILKSERPSGAHQINNGELVMAGFDLCDPNTNEKVLRCVYTLQKNEQGNMSIVDVDIVIPNDNISQVNFVRLEEGQTPESEYWDVEYNDRRTYAETVNRNLIDGDLSGLHDVSLSLMVYNDTVFGENADEINAKVGFKAEKYKWQEEMNMGSEPLPVGYADDFVGMGLMMTKIISHKKISFKINDSIYNAMLVILKTGYGELPALMSLDYEKDIIDGRFALINAELKADFSCGEKNYYDTMK